jgi:hypothetical protein
MAVLNDLDRFHLVEDVIDRVPKLGYQAGYVKQTMREKLIQHQAYITRYGEDMPEIRDWTWPFGISRSMTRVTTIAGFELGPGIHISTVVPAESAASRPRRTSGSVSSSSGMLSGLLNVRPVQHAHQAPVQGRHHGMLDSLFAHALNHAFDCHVWPDRARTGFHEVFDDGLGGGGEDVASQ